LQVNAELTSFVASYYGLPESSFQIAVCGIRVLSEHEDECCVTLQLHHSALIPMTCGIKGSKFNPSGENDITSPDDLYDQVVRVLDESFLSVATQPSNKISKGAKV
jgi:hypothetical protein